MEAIMSDKENKAVVDTDFSLEAIPESSSERRGFWSMFVVMLGFTFFSASMSVGARMSNAFDVPGFVTAVIIGGVILSLYTGLLA